MRFEYFMDYFNSELQAKDLLYIIDPKIKSTANFDENIIEKHKYKDRDILINRIDFQYHSKIIDVTDPIEILNKIKEIKRCEYNLK